MNLSWLQKLSKLVPIVDFPRTTLRFEDRLRWTIYILLVYFFLGSIQIYGLPAQTQFFVEQFTYLLGGNFGTLITLGIGPIVMASIILQLFVGGGLLEIDLTSHEGRILYNDLLRITTVFFALFESLMYSIGWFRPEDPVLIPIVAFQLFIGAILIMLLDDLSMKWGITSGVNLFILAAISRGIITRLFNNIIPGYVLTSFTSANTNYLIYALGVIGVTIATLSFAAYLQSLQIEIPLTIARMRGRSIRWPVKFLYTGVMPIILLFAFQANIILILSLLASSNLAQALGVSNTLMFIVNHFRKVPHLLYMIFVDEKLPDILTSLSMFIYFVYYVGGGALFSYLWVHAAGMDPRSLAFQLNQMGMSVLGYRRDIRALERLLARYIVPASVWGGAAVGLLAAITDIFGALASGTSLLLAVVIAYTIYEDLVRQNVIELIPLINQVLSKR